MAVASLANIVEKKNTGSATSLLCQATASQLLVIDLQTKLLGTVPGKVRERVVNNTSLLLRAAWLLGVPIATTTQYSKGLGPTDPDIGTQIPPATPHFEKTSFSCCGADGFSIHIADLKRPQVVIAGMEAHVCVLQSAFDLLAAGYQVFVLDDATCSRKLENYHNALLRLHQGGVTITSAESVIFEWLRDARHEQFKVLSSFIR